MKFWWLLGLLLLTKPDGGPIWFVDSQIVAVFAMAGGAAPTAITTMYGTFYVRESAEDVAKQLGWKP